MTKTMVGGMLTWLCGLFMLMAFLGSTAPTPELDAAKQPAAPLHSGPDPVR